MNIIGYTSMYKQTYLFVYQYIYNNNIFLYMRDGWHPCCPPSYQKPYRAILCI